MIFEQGDIVMVPFPYSDLSSIKTRPALVISNRSFRGDDVILAGITSHKSDYGIAFSEEDLENGNLPLISYIKAGKLISAEKSIIRSVEARLGKKKMKKVFEMLSGFIAVEEDSPTLTAPASPEAPSSDNA